MYIILIYDISKDKNGEKRWINIFKICKKYLKHVQNSVFEGEITKAQLYQLKNELNKYIDKTLASVIIIRCRQQKWIEKEFCGIENKEPDYFI